MKKITKNNLKTVTGGVRVRVDYDIEAEIQEELERIYRNEVASEATAAAVAAAHYAAHYKDLKEAEASVCTARRRKKIVVL